MESPIAMNLKKTKDFIKSYGSFLILPHVKADGDALGSALGLSLALKKLGKRAVVWCEDTLPYSLVPFFAGSFVSTRPEEDFEAVISVDTAEEGRLLRGYRDYSHLPLLNIDHHATNTEYGQVNLVLGGLSSTGELIAILLEELGLELDQEIASALYVAVVSDTGRFMYDSTTSKTLELGAKLLEAGADLARINKYLFGEKPMEQLRLMALATERAEFLRDDIVFCRLGQEDFDRLGFSDTDDVISMLRDIQGVNVAALVYDYMGNRKLSLRSKGQQNVDELASFFGGGGHKKAAGSPIKEEELGLLKEKLKELSHVGKDKSL